MQNPKTCTSNLSSFQLKFKSIPRAAAGSTAIGPGVGSVFFFLKKKNSAPFVKSWQVFYCSFSLILRRRSCRRHEKKPGVFARAKIRSRAAVAYTRLFLARVITGGIAITPEGSISAFYPCAKHDIFSENFSRSL